MSGSVGGRRSTLMSTDINHKIHWNFFEVANAVANVNKTWTRRRYMNVTWPVRSHLMISNSHPRVITWHPQLHPVTWLLWINHWNTWQPTRLRQLVWHKAIAKSKINKHVLAYCHLVFQSSCFLLLLRKGVQDSKSTCHLLPNKDGQFFVYIELIVLWDCHIDVGVK